MTDVPVGGFSFQGLLSSVTHEPEALATIRRQLEAEGDTHASASFGKLLALLTTLTRSRRVLDIGAGLGYSSGWFLQALPADGHLHALEIDRDCAARARENLRLLDPEGEASGRWTVDAGPAVRALHQLTWNRLAPFDVVLIDADPESAATYLKWALRLTTPGSVVVVRGLDALADADVEDAERAWAEESASSESLYAVTGKKSASIDAATGMYGALQLLRDDPRFASTAFGCLSEQVSSGTAVALITAASPPASAGTDVRIEPMTAETVKDALRVKNQGWRDTYDKYLGEEDLNEMDARLDKDVAAWSAMLARPGNQSRFAVARTSDGQVVGVATAAPILDDQDRFETHAKWQLFTCYVDKAWHGSGIASRLVDFVVGEDSCILWVLEDNARARAFYTKLGFVADGAVENLPDEWSGAREIRMIRNVPTKNLTTHS
ncbi:hypothetical protein HMPREF3160_02470 [Arthrobacter sp. HMSC06H05]|uniref:GNAT family N-acetyltransferase n=1 Tax=Arthrobacter sp. HMSC06H05 TaxID=1581128 RepID=UPI0008A49A89|nr:GNAT family N-acetyltransferase [Arthrobacter sp. HMSC06H05]OFT43606.1 hypothetical protein HMPREF3160_02470 [Arthrobacter sp. HMSC06H05]